MYKYGQLSAKAKQHCIAMQKKYNFPKLSTAEIIAKIAAWEFNKDGSLYNNLS
jgi:hypothetical protein